MITSENPNSITAIIPFFNEEKHLNALIKKVLPNVDTLVLVDDGSTDNSINQIPKNQAIILIRHSSNLGKGAALKTGLLKSIKINSRVTITLDADLQHDPNLIPSFLDKIKNCDCVIGSRHKDHSSMPIHRRASNLITSKLLSLKTGVKILDSQSGFRAFKTDIIRQIIPSYKGFEAESEMIVKVCKNKFNLCFVDIPTKYGDDNSKMKAIPAILGFIKVLLKT